MWKKLTTGVATLALVGLAAPALAASETGNITVSVTVGKILDLTIIDNTAGLVGPLTTTDDITNTADAATEVGKFKVQANSSYSLSIAPTATWVASSIDPNLGTLVKFTGKTNAKKYMGGELFIKSGSTTTNWTRTGAGAGTVGIASNTAGTKTWTLGAIFQPQYSGDTDTGDTGSPGVVAPAQGYETTATITATSI